ncbi:MAG: hypothetical protein RMK60_11715 [Burkholderiales bacterium]|nr:hypothetical protein [Burkholderiales bacterium]
MRRRLLLYVSSVGASLALAHGSSLRELHALPADAEGWNQFDAHLRAHAGVPVWIAVDSVEEIFRVETLPRTHGRDRVEMTARRLRHLLHHTPYRAVVGLGADGHAERFSFMGLTAPELLQPWLDVLRLHAQPIAGVWLAPLLYRPLLARLRLAQGSLLLVAEHTAGLRLAYFERGGLRSARLALSDTLTPGDPLRQYASEVERTRQALLAQRLLARGEPLQVVLIDPMNSLHAMAEHLPDTQSYRWQSVGRAQLLSMLGIPADLMTGSPDGLLLRLLPEAPAAGNLLPAELRLPYRRHRQGWALRLGAATVFGAGVLTAFALGLEARQLRQHAHTALAQAAQAEQRALQLRALVPAQTDIEAAWQALQAWRWVQARRRDPASDLMRVHRLAAGQAGVRPTRLVWQAPAGTAGAPPQIMLEAELDATDPLTARARIDGLIAAYQAAGWSARLTRWALDDRAAAELAGDFARPDGGPDLTFQLSLSPGREPGR